MATVLSVTNWTDNTNDKSITVDAGTDTIVSVIEINDGDGGHTVVDGTFTFNATTMTDALSGLSTGGKINNGSYNVYIYILKNYTGGSGSKTFHWGIHGGFGTSDMTIFCISGGDTTTQPYASAVSNTTGANPSTSATASSANDIVIEGIGGGNSLTASASQTVDGSSDSNLRTAHKTASGATSQTMSWTMSSSNYAQGVIIVKDSGGGGTIRQQSLSLLGVGI